MQTELERSAAVMEGPVCKMSTFGLKDYLVGDHRRKKTAACKVTRENYPYIEYIFGLFLVVCGCF